MSFQDHAPFPWLTIFDHEALRSHIERVLAEGDPRVAQNDAERDEPSGFVKRGPRVPLGEMRQCISIAWLLAVSPRALLKEKPFTALQVQNPAFIEDKLKRILRCQLKTAMLATHCVDEANKLAACRAATRHRVGVKTRIVVGRPRNKDDTCGLARRKKQWPMGNKELERPVEGRGLA